MTTDDKLVEVLARAACEANACDDFRCSYPTCGCKAGGSNFGLDSLSRLSAAGYAVVPIEPTEAMWTAGRMPILARDANVKMQDLASFGAVAEGWYDPARDGTEGHVTKGDTAVFMWRAMLNAAEGRG